MGVELSGESFSFSVIVSVPLVVIFGELESQVEDRMTLRGWLGVALIVFGIGYSIYTYVNAGPGDTYIIWWGLPIAGAAMVLIDLGGSDGPSPSAQQSEVLPVTHPLWPNVVEHLQRRKGKEWDDNEVFGRLRDRYPNLISKADTALDLLTAVIADSGAERVLSLEQGDARNAVLHSFLAGYATGVELTRPDSAGAGDPSPDLAVTIVPPAEILSNPSAAGPWVASAVMVYDEGERQVSAAAMDIHSRSRVLTPLEGQVDYLLPPVKFATALSFTSGSVAGALIWGRSPIE